jgi:hypothetical protein
VRQMILPSQKKLIATFTKVLTLRGSLNKDLLISLDPERA